MPATLTHASSWYSLTCTRTLVNSVSAEETCPSPTDVVEDLTREDQREVGFWYSSECIPDGR